MKNLKQFLLSAVVFAITALAFTAMAQSPTPIPTPTGVAVVASAASSPGIFASAWAFLWGPGGACLFSALFAIDQLLANCFPSLKANSVFELATVGLQKAEVKNPMPGTSA